ncbi:MAG TPA: hypothetical protein VLQ45_05085 [Thermoanaerobaculia bacterium]|nr:hypothetical protein [Thermoanaerobaculia bacterium]
MRRNVVLCLLSLLVLSTALSATTVVYVPVKRSVQMSDLVLVGHVLSMEAVYNAEGEIVTRIDLLVEEPLKGFARPGEIFSFHAWGGSLDGTVVETVGEAHYRLGEKVLVQLENIDGELHTLGLSFGKWNVVRDEAGAQWVTRSLDDLHMVSVKESPVTKLSLDRMREITRGERGRLSF